MRLAWSPMALEDRLNIMMRIAEDNPAVAQALDRVFREKARRAARYPKLYKSGRCANTHEIVIHPNYVMVYRISVEAVEIVRILHARQRWP